MVLANNLRKEDDYSVVIDFPIILQPRQQNIIPHTATRGLLLSPNKIRKAAIFV
jgi:hypothetical protein